MIFVTVGAQMPFDRLIAAADTWAEDQKDVEVFAQIGAGMYTPKHCAYTRFLEPVAYRRHMFSADLVVGHAGMGTIITGLELARPILVLPRRADLRETRNDHQLSTARRFARHNALTMAKDEKELVRHLKRWRELTAPSRIGSHASFDLLDLVRRFVETGDVSATDVDTAQTAPTSVPAPATVEPPYPMTLPEPEPRIAA
ncbi:MAG: glycosyltransferase [Planctomycetota bacterium]